MTKNNDALINDNTTENKDDTCIRDVPNKMHYVLFISICVVAFVGVAFLFYGVVYEFDFMPFNIKTKAGQSDWFSFLASYLGAWGTIIVERRALA